MGWIFILQAKETLFVVLFMAKIIRQILAVIT